MPASRRHHRALAVIVNCLGVLAAVPALPATAPRAAAAPAPGAPAPAAAAATPAAPTATGMPAAPPAAPPTSAATVPRPIPPVTVRVAPAGTPLPAYRIDVRNAGSSMVETTVRQELPAGTSATTVTAGGRASRQIGASAAGEVTWRLRLPARSTTTLNTALRMTAPGRPVTAPACAYGTDGTRPYDCATATWNAAPVPVTKVTAAPAWRRPPVLLAALAAFLVVTGGALWWWWQRRRQRSGAAPTMAGPSPVGRTGGPAGGGTLYPRAALPTPAGARRRRPPIWLLVGVAAAVLAGVVGAAAWTATQRVAAIDTTKQPTSGAWMGQSVTGPVGVPLRETAFEFTVYRVTCATAGQPIAIGSRQCQATVGVRNLTPEQQTWHGQLQRAYLPGGNWVSTDETATRVANLGRDVFAQPVAAGSRVVLPLVFTVNGSQPPKQLELRSGVFSAGVRVDVP
ncbi:hypothetical protein EV384_2328 [Micromonospora kangleipakensis]|uniref:DUF4352 domain-containing protein n=1 Tax=Micromonospora kangleipakensis TaxID=1077942 RepID=A0A4Q8B8V4_9ACTN|nr:hypothetical protein [Micromonospora kangleipakensis]RZU73898.1 hypothetical protein EV384_2328 [Micromonospora kangleipakensis]